MLGQIISIDDNKLLLKLNVQVERVQNLINLFVLIADNQKNFIGEIVLINEHVAEVMLLGEYINNNFIYGLTTKPSFGAKVDLISPEHVSRIFGVESEQNKKSITIGKSPFYNNISITANINSFFGEHFAIMGSTGSGKSCGFARLMQNLFSNEMFVPTNSNFFIFDAYGEYHNAFSALHEKNNKINFKAYTTNQTSFDDLIQIPLWLLDIDDISLLLGVEHASQIPIVEKALKLVTIFSKKDDSVVKNKNSIIARALIDILMSGRKPSQMRDQFISVLTNYNTPELNLETPVFQPGYTRPLKQCLLIDQTGKIRAIELIISFLQNYIVPDMHLEMPDGSFRYTLSDLSYAFDLALIDEGILRNEALYNSANYLKVRLNTLYNSENKIYFEYPQYVTKEEYINSLVTLKDGSKAQVVNFNINYIDDRLAKNITKIYSKLLFNYSRGLAKRASRPFNIILEEAHRYVQNDTDISIIGYNIFERIAKEGRKYGVLLGLITQRPSELSETVLAQCNNFMLFRMLHPSDIEFINRMVPNITSEVIKKMKTLQPGLCMTFGTAFKLPIITKMDMPNPSPSSNSCDLSGIWY